MKTVVNICQTRYHKQMVYLTSAERWEKSSKIATLISNRLSCSCSLSTITPSTAFKNAWKIGQASRIYLEEIGQSS
uniref:Uncharacterized protein n=1 Tax=Lepeophtheirus salmonis TaxID=72036 RepID=A0A0K2TBS8_LEPSM